MSKICMDKKYQTRDGTAVVVLCVDAPGDYPVKGYFAETGRYQEWCEDGVFFLYCRENELLDLIEVRAVEDVAADALSNAGPWVLGGPPAEHHVSRLIVTALRDGGYLKEGE
jgi:hypothetical protein